MSKMKKHYAVNLAPLIDVVFILLAFLLVYSKLDMVKSIEVDLPKVAGEISQEHVTHIIGIDEQGLLYWGQEIISEQDLREKLGLLPKNAVLNIKAHAQSHAQNIILVMRMLADTGINATQIMVNGQE